MRYRDLRPWIDTGDIILWKGNSVISRLIRLFSVYSHASLVVRMNDFVGDKVCTIEAEWPRMNPARLSDELRMYNGRAYLYKTTIDGAQREDMKSFAMQKLFEGIQYDVGGVLLNLLGIVSLNAAKYYCSEFVTDCYCHVHALDTTIALRPGDIPEYIKGTLAELIL